MCARKIRIVVGTNDGIGFIISESVTFPYKNMIGICSILSVDATVAQTLKSTSNGIRFFSIL